MNTQYTPCRTSIDSHIGRIAALILYPATALLIFAAFTLVVMSTFHSPEVLGLDYIWLFITGILAISIVIFLLWVSIRCYRMESKAIAFSEVGFTIKGHQNKQHVWSKIHGLGVIAFAADASGERYQKQLCIFLRPIDNTALKKLYRSYLYGAFHEKYYILMDYNMSIVATLGDACNQAIIDYRPTQIKP